VTSSIIFVRLDTRIVMFDIGVIEMIVIGDEIMDIGVISYIVLVVLFLLL